MLQGTVPKGLAASEKIELFELSRNNFQGTIPTEIGLMHDLYSLHLHENDFFGSIPTHIFNLTKLVRLMLQSNRLTGSIPSGMQALNQIQALALDHNRLKGQIPQLENMPNVELLHFHQNQLTGKAPVIRSSAKLQSYITDCGFPQYALPGYMECESCTICCNSESRCQLATSWTSIPIQGVGVMFALLLPLTIIPLFMIMYNETGKKGQKYDAMIYADDSVYHFILSDKKCAKLIFVFTAVIQFLLFYFFLEPSGMDNEDTAFQFSFICAENGLECRDLRSVGTLGWLMFSTVAAIYLASDFVLSILQIKQAIYMNNFFLLVSGYVILGLTCLAFFTSAVFNIALAASNTDLIVNAVILLFINDVDEKVLVICNIIWPHWTNSIAEELKEKNEACTKDSKDPKQNGSHDGDEL